MNVVLQLRRRWSRRTRICVYGGLLLAIAAAGFAGLRDIQKSHSSVGASAIPTAAKSSQPEIPDLAIERIIQHGHIVELQAKVSPGTTVMVNGQRAAVIWGDGEIKHFVGPLPDGISEIAITVQNDMGGINTQQISVSLP